MTPWGIALVVLAAAASLIVVCQHVGKYRGDSTHVLEQWDDQGCVGCDMHQGTVKIREFRVGGHRRARILLRSTLMVAMMAAVCLSVSSCSGETAGQTESAQTVDEWGGNESGSALQTQDMPVEEQFSDLDATQWYVTEGPAGGYIQFVVDRGVMKGYESSDKSLFGPNDHVTYRMAVTVLYRYVHYRGLAVDDTSSSASGSTTTAADDATDLTDTDNSDDSWSSAAVRWGRSIGIFKSLPGDSGTDSFLDRGVTRQDLAVMVYNYMRAISQVDEGTANQVDFDEYTDGYEISSYATSAMEYCVSNGIITTIGDTRNILPLDISTRAQTAKLITRIDQMLNNIENGAQVTYETMPDEYQFLTGNSHGPIGEAAEQRYDATAYGIGSAESAATNTVNLQALIALVSRKGGGTIYFPNGEYRFCCTRELTNDGGLIDCAVRCYSNVSIVGESIDQTVFRLTGTGLTLIDGQHIGYALFGFAGRSADTLSNCTFSDFTIEAEDELSALSETDSTYSATAKGFAFEYVRDCTFERIRIEDTPATGLGIDFLSNVVITEIQCDNCGANWRDDNGGEGGAGIGIGTGAWYGKIPIPNESFIVYNCVCQGCGHFGIFIEDQIRWAVEDEASYPAGSYIVDNTVENNRFGGIGIRGSGGAVVKGNVISGSKYGIYIDYFTRDIKVFDNILEDNIEKLDLVQPALLGNHLFGVDLLDVSGVDGEYAYTGKAIKPVPSVKLVTACTKVSEPFTGTSSIELEAGVDYKVSYEDNVEEGTASITVTGIGDYTGTLKIPFKIVSR